MLYAIIILSILVVILLLCIGVLLYGMKNNKKTLDGILGNDDVTEEEIISMVNEGNEQGLIHDDEVEMITNIFEFSEKEVRDVMTPRSDVVGIDKHTTMDETIKIMLENNYSRYPVFDDDLDNIVGILYFKDFVKAYLKDKNQTIEQIMVEPLFVHPTKNISELFKRMQKEKIHMVIVVDEYGQTEGIIAHPDAPETRAMAAEMEESYGRTVLPVSCLDLDEAQLGEILQKVLYEFPVRELDFALPRWVTMLDKGHWLQTEVYTAAMQLSEKISRMKDVSDSGRAALDCEAVENAALSGMNLADGVVRITVLLKPEVFYKVLSEQTGLEIGDEAGLMPCIIELAKAKRAYEKIRSAMEQVEATGYGIVMPSIDELSLEQPEIVRQGGRYGVRLEASAPSIHMMKAVIHTELSPIVGTEKQSEDLVQSLLQDFEDDPVRLWESNIFGKSLHELVNDGLQNKLLHMPQEARGRLQETLERVINEGCTGLICILI